MSSQLPLKERSYWLQTSTSLELPRLDDEITVDVAIVGGGIGGLTTGYMLAEAGLRVAILEKHTIAGKTTGETTGKVTMQHGLIYAELVKRFGRQRALTYATAYTAAFADISRIIEQNNIDCDWHIRDNFVYTTEAKNLHTFQQEAKVASDLGLPATFETALDLPFPVAGAVKFTGQAYFNAAEYTRQLACLLRQKGSFVFEHSQAKHITEGTPCRVTTAHGCIIAKNIVIATKVPPAPLAARFTYALNEYPHTSYIVAGKATGAPGGMYISPDQHHYSILPVQQNGESLVLIGGENHIPGLGNAKKRHKTLAQYARDWFGIEQIDFRWKAMDYMAYDKLPIAGPLYPWSKHIFVVTGFKKWGLTTSMVTAKVIRDRLMGQTTPEMQLCYPHRLSAPLAMPGRLAQELRHIFS